MYQLKILVCSFIILFLIPLAVTLLEALCLISLLPSLCPLLGKDVLPINYHFYGTIYQLILNRILIHLNLKQRWKTICCHVDWLSDFDINDSWLLTVDTHRASTLLARLQSTSAPSSSMGVIFSFNFCFFIVLFLLEPSTLLLFIVTDKWWK